MRECVADHHVQRVLPHDAHVLMLLAQLYADVIIIIVVVVIILLLCSGHAVRIDGATHRLLFDEVCATGRMCDVMRVRRRGRGSYDDQN